MYFYFQLKRKPLFYGLNYLLPVIVTAALTVFVFLLPAESGEKIGYCLTVLLAFMVILTLIAADLPTTAANTSLLGMDSYVFSDSFFLTIVETYGRAINSHVIPSGISTNFKSMKADLLVRISKRHSNDISSSWILFLSIRRAETLATRASSLKTLCYFAFWKVY